MTVPRSHGDALIGYELDTLAARNKLYYDGDITRECGLATENTGHMLQCILLTHPCTRDDLCMFNDRGKHVLNDGRNRFDDTTAKWLMNTHFKLSLNIEMFILNDIVITQIIEPMI